MAFISIIAPGSLRVESSEFSFPAPCTVRTVSLENANIGSYAASANTSGKGLVFAGAQARLMALASQVLMSGAAVQPPNPCPGACQYDITFNAPFASCSPVSSTFDYNLWLPSTPQRYCSYTRLEFASYSVGGRPFDGGSDEGCRDKHPSGG